MHVAVTGGNGYIGTSVVAALGNRGASVRLAGRNPVPPDGVVGVYLDIHDPKTWGNLLIPFPPERLVHCAWEYLDNFDDTRHYLELLPDHLRFLAWCATNGITDITVAGTCFEYGRLNGEMREEMHTEPATAYGIAKDALRRALEHAADHASFTLKWARIFFVKGEAGAEKGVFKAVREAGVTNKTSLALSGGEQLLDYISRREVGAFLAGFCLQDAMSGVVNCCSGTPVALRRLIEDQARAWPELRLEFGALPYRAYEPMAFWGNREKMDRVVRRRPATAVINGILIGPGRNG